MKLVIIFLICFCIALIGLGISRQYTIKCRFYSSLVRLLEDMKLGISFKKEKLLDILDKYDASPELNSFILSFKKYLSGAKLDLSSVREIDTEDLQTLEVIVVNLGHYNSKNELLQLNGFIERVKSKEVQANMDKSKLAPMVIKLSVLLSIAVGIILL